MLGAAFYFAGIALGIADRRRNELIPIAIALVFVSIAGATGYADYAEYSAAFYAAPYYDNELFRYPGGWMDLCRVFSSMGIPYNIFHASISAVSLGLICVTYWFYTRETNFALALLMIYPLLIECIQLRSFLASSICICGLILLRKRTIKRVLIYGIIVLLSMRFHSSAVVFLLAPFAIVARSLYERCQKKSTSRRREVTCLLALVATLSVVVFLIAYYSPQILTFFLHARDATYLADIETKPTTVLRAAVVYVVNIGACIICERVIVTREKHGSMGMLARLMSDISIILLATVPLLLFDYNFYRFLRMFMPVTIMLAAKAAALLPENGKRNIFVIASIGYCLIGTTLDLIWTLDTTAIPILIGVR